MKPAPLPIDDAERQRVLGALRLNEGPRDPQLDAVARLANQQAGCAVGAIGVVNGEHLWLQSAVGLPATLLPSKLALCAMTIVDEDGPLVVVDALLDPRFADATQPDLPLIYVNPAFERLTGYGRDEVLGRDCRLLQGGQREQSGVATLRDALAAGRACTVTLHNHRRDGSAFVNELHVAPVHDASGRLTHFVGMQNDVTQRKNAADQLALSEDMYRSVAAAISDGLLVIGADGSIVAANPAACEMLGVDASRLIGSRLSYLGFRLQYEDGTEVPETEHPVRSVRQGWPV